MHEYGLAQYCSSQEIFRRDFLPSRVERDIAPAGKERLSHLHPDVCGGLGNVRVVARVAGAVCGPGPCVCVENVI